MIYVRPMQTGQKTMTKQNNFMCFQASNILRTLWKINLLITKMYLLQLHFHFRHNTWLQWIWHRQLQDETRNIKVLGLVLILVVWRIAYFMGYIWCVCKSTMYGTSNDQCKQCWQSLPISQMSFFPSEFIYDQMLFGSQCHTNKMIAKQL